MKTVIDAVNEFKGSYSHKNASDTCDQIIVAMKSFSGYKFGDIEVGSGNRYDGRGSWRAICTFAEFNQCVAEMSEGSFVPKASKNMIETVYTQAMVDNGELPSIGMSCLYKIHHKDDIYFDDCFIVGVSKDGKWLAFHDHENHLHNHNIAKGVYRFSPIDQRTDKEKAIDEFMAEHLKGGVAFKHLISLAYDKWVSKS